MGPSGFTLICAVLLLRQEQEEHGNHTSLFPLLFLDITARFDPRQPQIRPDQTGYISDTVWG